MKLTHTYNYVCKDIFVKGNILDMIDSIRILSNKQIQFSIYFICNCLILAMFERYLVVLLMRVVNFLNLQRAGEDCKEQIPSLDSFFVLQVVGVVMAHQANDKQK